jgi:hypothetical protein
MHKQPNPAHRPDPLPALLAGVDPKVAAVVNAAPFRTVMISRAWSPFCGTAPEIEAVVLIDGELTAPALAELIEVADAAEDNRRALILVAGSKRLRDAAKRRLFEAIAARRQAGGQA